MKRERASFYCGKFKLEGVYCLPDGDGRFPAVVVCHPHPLYGGSMDNNVVQAIGSALVERSLAVLMFNFRGVGGSQGAFGGGEGEQEDVRAALDWLCSQAEVDGARVGLAGYSFGAAVALAVACSDQRVKAVALVSLPLMDEAQVVRSQSALGGCSIPKLLVCGGEDFVVPMEALGRLVERTAEPKEVRVIPGADHFWWGDEGAVAQTVADFFCRHIG